jgi:hypothetical protein
VKQGLTTLTVQARDHFPGSIETSKAARALLDQALLRADGEERIALDFNGVDISTLSASLILLRSTRRFLDSAGSGEALLVNLSPNSRALVEEALGLRFDLDVRYADEQAIVISSRFPTEIVDPETGILVKIGSARRKMAMVAERDGAVCAWCSKPLTYHHPEATLDHVLPHSADGSQDWRNMLLACKSCNHTRKRTSARKWLAKCLQQGFQVNIAAVEAAIARVGSEPSLRRAYHRRRASHLAN